ncbi:TPA: zf-HC2 domain-containing protein [Neisseria subflava]
MKKCRKMTDLISKQQDQVRLSLFNRIALVVHLSLCPHCREYKKQLELISNAMHKIFR